MSVASSSTFPCIKIQNPSSSNSLNSSYSYIKFRKLNSLTIRCSQAEGPLRRPLAPSPLPTPVKPTPPSSSSPPPPPPPSPPKPTVSTVSTVGEGNNVITMEFQRQKAKQLQEYFKLKKLEEANQGPFFGFIPKNEISNGRAKLMVLEQKA